MNVLQALRDTAEAFDVLHNYTVRRSHKNWCSDAEEALSFMPDVNVKEAIAAVAELIEAAVMANGDHIAPHDCYATGPLTGAPIRDLVVCPGCRLAAAIANVRSKP